jgi:hypothetical protein
MRPLNVNYDGTGWNADYVAGLTKDEFVDQHAATTYGHIQSINERIKAGNIEQYIPWQLENRSPIRMKNKPLILP